MRAKDNPFQVSRIESLAVRLPTTWDQLLERLHRLRCRAAIVGPHGTGKTALLLELCRRLEQQGYRVRHLRLSVQCRSLRRAGAPRVLAGISRRDIVAVDGAEQLNWLQWWWVRWVSRRAAGLIITSHRQGRLPTLIGCRTSVELLRDLVDELLEARGQISEDVLRELFDRHQGNIRDCLRELYDRWANGEQLPLVERSTATPVAGANGVRSSGRPVLIEGMKR